MSEAAMGHSDWDSGVVGTLRRCHHPAACPKDIPPSGPDRWGEEADTFNSSGTFRLSLPLPLDAVVLLSSSSEEDDSVVVVAP